MKWWIRSVALAVAVGASVLGPAGPARAAFTVTVSGDASATFVDNGAGDLNSSANSILGVGATGSGLVFTVTANSNKPGQDGPLGAFMNDLTFSMNNNTSSSKTITIVLYDDPDANVGYTNPLGSTLILQNSLAASQFFAGNDPNAKVSVFSEVLSDAGAVVATSSTLSLSGASTGIDSAPILFNRPGALFDMRQTITLTLGAGGVANFATTTSVIAPEPATLASAVVGASCLGLFGLRRRRRAALA